MRKKYYTIPTEHDKINIELNIYINSITSTGIVIKKNKLIKSKIKKILINF